MTKNTTAITTTVSAPGKVLLAGGYLVLESPNVGLVIGANQRFYCTVEKTLTSATEDQTNAATSSWTVISPQFHSSWTYCHNQTHGNDRDSNEPQGTTIQLWQRDIRANDTTTATAPPSKNQFVESTLRLVLAYFWSKDMSLQTDRHEHYYDAPLKITIRADNDFYSLLPHLPPPPLDVITYLKLLSELPPFAPCPLDEVTGKPCVHKTGLGSSAALVTSLVAALYYHFMSSTTTTTTATLSTKITSPNKDQHLAKIHRLAQLCHCYAQGKVGSGFDVSAAIHGSHIYQKQFPPAFYQLMTLLEQCHPTETAVVALPMSLAKRIQHYVDDDDRTHNESDGQHDVGDDSVIVAPISLQSVGLQLILADVSGGGSESPSMARQVLAWKERQQQATATTEPTEKNEWDQLKELNQHIVKLLQQLTETSSSAGATFLQDELDAVSKLPACEWKTSLSSPLSSLLYELHSSFQASRYALKSMGSKAGVPIEPDIQTNLCDATMALPGVVTALVPGAGGYDAIACLYIDRLSVREGILQLWLNWKASDDAAVNLRILPLSVKAVGFGEGLRIETDTPN